MVRLAVILLGLSLFPGWVFAVSLNLDGLSDEVEFGKFLSVDVRYEGGKPQGDFDLQQWQDDFFIEYRGKEREPIDDRRVRVIQHLRLYPRGTGSLVLERIAYGGTFFGPVRIQSIPPLRNQIDASPRLSTLPKSIWSGQLFSLRVKVPLLHPSNHIDVETAEIPGFRVLGTERKSEADSVELSWYLVAERSGEQLLAPPAIEQRGRGRWRFYLPFSRLGVKPRPSYLLPGVPTGKPDVQVAIKKEAGKKWWELSIQSSGDLPRDIYGVRNFMATMAGVTAGDVERRDQPWAIGRGAARVYRVAVPDWAFGGKPLELELRYFDTDAGIMKEIPIKFPGAWNFPGIFLWLLMLPAVALAWALIFMVRRLIGAAQDLQHFRQRLAASSDAHELRRVILAAGQYVSLDDWARGSSGNVAQSLAQQLNALSFSPEADLSFEAIRQAVIEFYRLPGREAWKMFFRFLIGSDLSNYSTTPGAGNARA
ncbi:MAG: hypothetical protein ACWA44_02185 [Thiotrichales bacterium]